MGNREELEERVKKLLVRLNNLGEGKRLSTMVQIVKDLLVIAYSEDHAAELFKGKSVLMPLMLVLWTYESSKGLQQDGWALLCWLLEVCPDTLPMLARPLGDARDWEVIGVHQQILRALTLHRSDCGVMQVCLRALALLLMSGEILMSVLEDESDVFELVVEAMRTFSTCEEVQLQACSALQVLLEGVAEQHLLEFVERQDHLVVLMALSRFPANEKLALLALRVLLPLAGPASNVEVLMSKRECCYRVACRAMNAFPHNELLQEVACCLLHRFTSESYHNMLVLNGVHRVTVKACLSFPSNRRLQTAALSCLAALTKTIVVNEELERDRSGEDGEERMEREREVKNETVEEEEGGELCWVDACCMALEVHAEDTKVQEAACWALNSLLLHADNACLGRVFEEQEDKAPVHTLLMAAMLLHSSSVCVFLASASALCSLIQRSSKMAMVLLCLGIHYNVVDVMKKHGSSSAVCEGACSLLHALFNWGRASLDEGTLVLGQILTCMHRHSYQAAVQLQGLRTSLVLLNPDRRLREHGVSVADPDTVDVSLRVLKTQFVLEGAHNVYLEALNRFIGDADIQEYGLGVLSALADCSGAVDLMCQQGAIDTVLHALQMFPQEQEIHYWGMSLLFHLVSRKKLSRSHVPVVSSVLVQSVRQYRPDQHMLLKGLQVVWRLMDAFSGAAEELEKEDFHREIFQLLREREPQSDQLQCVSSLCLAKLASDPEIRYRLLEQACEDGDVAMATCLIQLGADVNKKTKTKSLIYQVCERGGPLALVELLLAAGVREQQVGAALPVSVRKDVDDITVLLLARLGLDPPNSALRLGGFRLGNPRPAWLAALLSERRAPPAVCSGNSKGQRLVQQIQALQVRKGHLDVMGSPGDLLTPGEDSEEEDDYWADSPIFMEHSVSNGLPRMGRLHSDSPEELRARPGARQQGICRRAISEGAYGESQLNDSVQGSLSHNQRELWSPGSPSPMGPLQGGDRERIRLLDLSGNELDCLSCLTDEGSVQSQLEHLFRLDLSQNSLSEFPSALCQSLRSLTRLDLQDNQLRSLPAELLGLPALTTLNAARNHVGPLLQLGGGVSCPSLRELNLAYNHITTFPTQLGHAMGKLEELHLEGNRIAGLTPPLALADLRVLDISKNEVENICEGFLSQCGKLDTFNASSNKLTSLCQLPARLSTLKLAQNSFTHVPPQALALPNLRSLDMKKNQVVVLPPPAAWLSGNLRELMLCQNHISVLDLSGSVSKWARLDKLHLSDNKLTEIPREIGELLELTSLDVSRNAGLRSFPNDLGRLGKLWDLPLDGLQLQLDLKQIGKKTKDIVRFLQQRLKKAVPYFRMKLIVVGTPGSGKTTLIQQLMKLKRSHRHSESHSARIHVQDWNVRLRDRKSMVLNVWDLTGGEEYCGLLPHLVSPRALYLVLYDLSQGPAQVSAIKPWLYNIKVLAPQAPVILVGTHVDVCEESQVQECVRKVHAELQVAQGFPTLRDHHTLCAREDSDAIARLRKVIAGEIAAFKLQGQPVIGQLVPESYVELERRVEQQRAGVAADFPVLTHTQLLQLRQDSLLLLEETDIPHAVHFLSEAGVLLHFDDPAFQLRELYFIDPQWLCNVISQSWAWLEPGLSGVVGRPGLEKFLQESGCFPWERRGQYLLLLEKFFMALPFSQQQLLVPCSLSELRPAIELPHCERSEVMVRLYELPYFPMGFWPRHISRLLTVSNFMLGGRERILRPNRVYWRTGLYLSWSPEAYCLVEAATLHSDPASYVRITVPCSRKGHVLLGQVVDHIDSVLEEWFPGLLATGIHGNAEMLKKWALYSFDDRQEWSRILLEDLLVHFEGQAKDGQLDCVLVDPTDPRRTVPVAQVGPDLVLSDQPACTMLCPEELLLDQHNDNLLGDGGFGSVYRAVYKNEDVAVKVFKKHVSELYVLRLVRQELAVLGKLHHPSLVVLLGVGVGPPRLLMELAPRGSLDVLFQHEDSLNRKLQHRIALQLADGLRYLHSSMIIYRDLKPHNVLLFNLKTDSEVIAKITDYGIAQYCCSMGVRSSEGTPGFRAPEVARGNVIYNVQADVFSFGLLMYDLLTCGERISDGMKFPGEFDEIAVQGKLPDPVKHYGCSPWPGFQGLMRTCMMDSPQDRPTSTQVFERLNSGEMLCLMREHTLSGLPAECLAICCPRHGAGGGARVWVGGGSSSQRIGSVTCVNIETEESMTQEVDGSPVLCLATVRAPEVAHDWLVAGTQAGSLVVMDTQSGRVLHCLKRVTDSVTSLFFHSHPGHSSVQRHLLVGTADGALFVYEESVLQCADGEPVKVVRLGTVRTPLMGLMEAGGVVWAACGSRVFSLSMDYHIWTSMDTKASPHCQQQSLPGGEACISRLLVDKFVFVCKTRSHIVEVWDKKSQKMVHLINCAQLLRPSSSRRGWRPRAAVPREEPWPGACVKALLAPPGVTLWVGTRAGHILLLELSTLQLLQVLHPHGLSICHMVPALIETPRQKSVVLMLGRRCAPPQAGGRQDADAESVLRLWDGALPLEVTELNRHCEQRAEIANRMREQDHD